MSITYQPIASVTLNSSSTISFTSIPQTYTDLVLVTSLKIVGGSDLDVMLNNDSGANYAFTSLYGTGGGEGGTRSGNLTYMRLDYYGYVEDDFNHVNIANFQNYSNTTTFKTVLARASHADNGIAANACLWRSTAAITSINILATCQAGSTATLYGIAKA